MKHQFLFINIFLGAALFLLPVAGLEGATLSGKVAYKGPEVKAKKISFGAEIQCAQGHKETPTNEDVVVNENGTLRWSLVYVKDEEGNLKDVVATPSDPVLMDQVGCIFKPHVVAAVVGQPVEFKNSDDVLHNVRSVCKENPIFNVAQPIKGMKTVRKFEAPEVGIEIRCDVHFWMKSFVHILDNPFFSVTGDDGSFKIEGLPEGTYTVSVWHEKLGEQSQSVTVGADEDKTVDFALE